MTEVYCNSCGAIDRPMFDGEDDRCSKCGRGNIEDIETIIDGFENDEGNR